MFTDLTNITRNKQSRINSARKILCSFAATYPCSCDRTEIYFFHTSPSVTSVSLVDTVYSCKLDLTSIRMTVVALLAKMGSEAIFRIVKPQNVVLIAKNSSIRIKSRVLENFVHSCWHQSKHHLACSEPKETQFF